MTEFSFSELTPGCAGPRSYPKTNMTLKAKNIIKKSIYTIEHISYGYKLLQIFFQNTIHNR